jgi:hypothetical protein
MSKRKYPAAAMALLAASTLVGVGLANAQAASAGLPSITGGGHTQNSNSGSGVDQTTFGGFNARATEPGATTDDDDVTYTARGEVQGRSSVDETHETVGKVHGDVVCIANLGPADAESGGQEDSDVWEIRFKVERGTAGGVAIPAGVYASVFVQDNGPHNDFSDENFDSGEFTNPECGDVTEFQLEPHQGQITVHRG